MAKIDIKPEQIFYVIVGGLFLALAPETLKTSAGWIMVVISILYLLWYFRGGKK